MLACCGRKGSHCPSWSAQAAATQEESDHMGFPKRLTACGVKGSAEVGVPMQTTKGKDELR